MALMGDAYLNIFFTEQATVPVWLHQCNAMQEASFKARAQRNILLVKLTLDQM